MTVRLLTALLVAGPLIGPTQAQSTQAQSTQAQAQPDQKLLIEVGWDAPTPALLRSSIAQLQRRPFSGMMVNLSAGKTIFNKVAYPGSAFAADRRDLAATRFGRFQHNFVTIWSARQEGWDWFSDADWQATQMNARNFARTAKAGNFKGFFFDPEPYGTNPWSYSRALYPNQTFAAVQAKVRARGAAFLSAIQSEMPDVIILTLFGVSHVKAQAEEAGALKKADWALLASFIDGMLDVIGPKAQLIDGNEGSYYYTSARGFSDFRAYKDSARAFVSPENRTKYDRQVKVAYAVFADGLLNLLKSPRFFGYYLPGDRERQRLTEFNTYQALKASDRYVWVYNENMDWWGSFGKGVSLPPGLEDLLGRAAQKVNQGRSLGFEVASFMAPALRRFGAKVQITGLITQGGKGVDGVYLDSGLPMGGGDRGDASCQPSGPDGYYTCTLPPNWTGKLTPSKAGLSFNPPQRTFSALTRNEDNVSFEARQGRSGQG
jgi:hypothetical protein